MTTTELQVPHFGQAHKENGWITYVCMLLILALPGLCMELYGQSNK